MRFFRGINILELLHFCVISRSKHGLPVIKQEKKDTRERTRTKLGKYITECIENVTRVILITKSV